MSSWAESVAIVAGLIGVMLMVGGLVNILMTFIGGMCHGCP